jgi:hypothetical protein
MAKSRTIIRLDGRLEKQYLFIYVSGIVREMTTCRNIFHSGEIYKLKLKTKLLL